jgi:hypothetical protein
MMKKIFCLVIIGLLCTVMFSATAWAACPEGKSEVILYLPNGMEKTMCIPDQALPGLQNAAENSDGTIVPSSCPCWNEKDIIYYEDNKMLVACSYEDGTAYCINYDKKVILEAQPNHCANYVTEVDSKLISKEQWTACYSLLPLDEKPPEPVPVPTL